MIFDRDATIEAFRQGVLEKLDDLSREFFNEKLGAIDTDLPHIFPAIDAQVDRLAKRYGIVWAEVGPLRHLQAPPTASLLAGQMARRTSPRALAGIPGRNFSRMEP